MSEKGSVLWKWVNGAGIHPMAANPLSVGLAPAPNNSGLSLGGFGCRRSGVEGDSRGGALVLTHTSVEGLSVIPSVLERRDREELQFSKGKCTADRKAKPWAALNCVTSHWHRGCVGSLLVLGSRGLRARPLGCVGAALCPSWSTGWERELKSSTRARLTLALCGWLG